MKFVKKSGILEKNEIEYFERFLMPLSKRTSGCYVKRVRILLWFYDRGFAVHGRQYTLALTNYEVKQMFEDIILDWFDEGDTGYNGFIRALLCGALKEMNAYMNQVALAMFSSFDGGTHPSGKANPERFYHRFVLGLLVDLSGRYEITSNPPQ